MFSLSQRLPSVCRLSQIRRAQERMSELSQMVRPVIQSPVQSAPTRRLDRAPAFQPSLPTVIDAPESPFLEGSRALSPVALSVDRQAASPTGSLARLAPGPDDAVSPGPTPLQFVEESKDGKDGNEGKNGTSEQSQLAVPTLCGGDRDLADEQARLEKSVSRAASEHAEAGAGAGDIDVEHSQSRLHSSHSSVHDLALRSGDHEVAAALDELVSSVVAAAFEPDVTAIGASAADDGNASERPATARSRVSLPTDQPSSSDADADGTASAELAPAAVEQTPADVGYVAIAVTGAGEAPLLAQDAKAKELSEREKQAAEEKSRCAFQPTLLLAFGWSGRLILLVQLQSGAHRTGFSAADDRLIRARRYRLR